MKTLITIFSLISTFLMPPGFSPALATSPEDSNLIAVTAIRSECSFPGSRPAIHSTLQLIAGINNPGGNTYKTVEFTLKKNRILRLYAMGEGKPAKMLDYGGIEDTENGKI